jgi:hypothetical protein
MYLSSTTNAVNIPLSINSSTAPTASQQGSNGSSISSGIGGKESSSISSFDEYLLDNNTSSSSYTKDESVHEQLFPEMLNNEDKQKAITNEKVPTSNGKLFEMIIKLKIISS